MFDQIPAAPPDAILGLTDAFKSDANARKVNLSVGVYQNEKGATVTLRAVSRAEARLLEQSSSKSYMPISGDAGYTGHVRKLLFGEGHAVLTEERAVTAHTPGGTGGLRVGADLIHAHFPKAAIWTSAPTWANHKAIFEAAGVATRDYPYYDAATRACDFDALLDALNRVPAGDFVLLHVCCHNPTGVDLDAAQWQAVADCAAAKGWIPFLDFAYQGFGDGIEADRAPVMRLGDAGVEFLISSSYSKNFGLYCERTGAFTLVAANRQAAQHAFSQVKRVVRANYSNPPAHGGHIVRTILDDAELAALWREELTAMRERIRSVRQDLVAGLAARGVAQDFSYINDQKGMFSFSGLNDAQVAALRETYSIYIVKGGRINVAGLTPDNLNYVCDAIAQVL